MVANIRKLKGKIAENGYTMKSLSEKLGICETSLRRKINYPEADFYLEESFIIKRELKLTNEEYLEIFIGE